MADKPPIRKSVWREWIESFVIAVFLALFIREFFFQAFKIPSSSMIPTLLIGDRLMVSKLWYGAKIRFTDKRLPGLAKPRRGDIIVFIYPEDGKRDFIKRLIAFGGETLEIRDGDIYVNGKHIDHGPIGKIYYYNRGPYGHEGRSIRVPEGSVYVLGDNSASSSDSRYWGFVPEANIIGRAEFVYWPLTRMRFVNPHESKR